ncbi:DUF1345 domain-containing protein [Leucobacter coleopterorum]|uniref:DUF1345 domain-containing protein n=1 Tax=Leucobacter coleopterorum TaxID=2714933 RepID=A0ABX6JY00_9MICO|nr:DUF1345 domain-containing protein [Leucobacter coleopterorum]QIM19098.1 DUF1345 domain-containing protein [Leucobacter coleopterorum]
MSKLPVRAQVRLRWAVAILVGVVVGAVTGNVLGLAAGLLAGWAALAIISTTWTLMQVWPMDAAATRDHAILEDPGRRTAQIVAIVGSVASLGAVAAVVVHSRYLSGVDAYVDAGIAMLSVVSSWVLIQTDYMLRYAKEYYLNDAGGIEFNQKEAPEYSDFVYFSVVLGVSYSVADAVITRNGIRRIVIGQTVLGYLFGAGIIATIISLIAAIG